MDKNNFLEMLVETIIEQVGNQEDAPLELKAATSLTQIHQKSKKFIEKLTSNRTGDLDKVYEEQFNTIIHYSKVLINAINEVIGDENE